MKKAKYLFFLVLFILVGELVIRLDKKYDPLNNAPHKIVVEIDESDVKIAVENGGFSIDSTQFRIMVLGDSYIHGGGINPSQKFSRVLKERLKTLPSIEKEIIILDVSRSSNNTLDNYNSFLFYVDKFKPNAVVLGYNFNDILGDLTIDVANVENSQAKVVEVQETQAPEQMVKKIPLLKQMTKNLYRMSKLMEYTSTKIQKELKLKGIVLPLGEFHFLTQKAYNKSQVNLEYTFSIFSGMSSKCDAIGAKFIFYYMPEFNLLKQKSLFHQIDAALQVYFDKNPQITYLDGKLDFDPDSGDEYMLSRYDGHPNAKAHWEMAGSVMEVLK